MVRGRDTRELVGFRVLRLAAAGGAPEGEHVCALHLLSPHVSSDFPPNRLETTRKLDFTGPCPDCLIGATCEFHRLPVRFGSSPQEGTSRGSLRSGESPWPQMCDQRSRARGPPCAAQPVRPISMGASPLVRSGLSSAFASGQEQDLYKRSLSVCAGPFI